MAGSVVADRPMTAPEGRLPMPPPVSAPRVTWWPGERRSEGVLISPMSKGFWLAWSGAAARWAAGH